MALRVSALFYQLRISDLEWQVKEWSRRRLGFVSVSVLSDWVKKATEIVLCVHGRDRVEKLLLLSKLSSSFGQGQVDRKENEVYCEFVSVETRV